jgi:hypothetical protein
LIRLNIASREHVKKMGQVYIVAMPAVVITASNYMQRQAMITPPHISQTHI